LFAYFTLIKPIRTYFTLSLPEFQMPDEKIFKNFLKDPEIRAFGSPS